jgi:SAM-dependent methyltransferase
MTIDIDIDLSEQEAQAARAESLALQILGQFSAGVELLTIELGRRLGLYDALLAAGPVTAAQFADRAGIAPRYAVEWLDQQAAAGIVDVAGHEQDSAERLFLLPGAHAAVLLDRESPAYLLGAAPLLFGVAKSVPDVADAYATGRGVEYADLGGELRYGIAELNRPGFTLGMRSWVEQLPDIAARLDRGGVILDAGCGEGWSSIGLAHAFPEARIVGVDLDPESVEVARCHVEDAGLADRVTIVQANAADVRALHDATGGEVLLVTAFQALHDMGRPVQALSAFRELLVDGGAVLVGDEHGEDVKAAPADETERLKLAMSVLHCAPATWAESDEVVNGTVLRSHTFSTWVREAGFAWWGGGPPPTPPVRSLESAPCPLTRSCVTPPLTVGRSPGRPWAQGRCWSSAVGGRVTSSWTGRIRGSGASWNGSVSRTPWCATTAPAPASPTAWARRRPASRKSSSYSRPSSMISASCR